MKHEEFIHAVAGLALALLSEDEKSRLNAKIVYGIGSERSAYGVTRYGAWKDGKDAPLDLIEICACTEEGPLQLAETVVHELGHALAGRGTGHGKIWKAACRRLGLTKAKATGRSESWEVFVPDLELAIKRLEILDGKPLLSAGVGVAPVKPNRPCSEGIGTKGGKSRGEGSGSRLRKWTCQCAPKPVIVRVASDTFAAHCDECGEAFQLSDVPAPTSDRPDETDNEADQMTGRAEVEAPGGERARLHAAAFCNLIAMIS